MSSICDRIFSEITYCQILIGVMRDKIEVKTKTKGNLNINEGIDNLYDHFITCLILLCY